MQPWEKHSSNVSRGVFIFFFFSEVHLQGCLSVWFKPLCVSRYLIFWQDQAGLQLLTVHPSDTVSSQEFAVLLGRKQSISQLCLVQVKPPRLKTQHKASRQLIVNAQVPVLSAPGVLAPTAAHGVGCRVHGSRCACLGGAGAQKGLLILPALSCQTPVAPSSSLEMSQ